MSRDVRRSLADTHGGVAGPVAQIKLIRGEVGVGDQIVRAGKKGHISAITTDVGQIADVIGLRAARANTDPRSRRQLSVPHKNIPITIRVARYQVRCFGSEYDVSSIIADVTKLTCSISRARNRFTDEFQLAG